MGGTVQGENSLASEILFYNTLQMIGEPRQIGSTTPYLQQNPPA